jgi:hypothetical protein
VTEKQNAAPLPRTRPFIGVEDITALIRRLGWKKLEHPNANLLVYEKGVDDFGKPIKLVLPNGNNYADAPSMIRTAVELVADLAGRPVRDLVQQIRNRGSDILRQRLLAETRITSLPLEIAPRIVGYLRDLVYYAACSEEDPRPFFEKGLKVGKDYTAKCGFGHTFPGSFGLSIEMPIPPNPNDLLLPAGQVAPFERRLMQRVARGLFTAAKGVREGDVTVLTKDYSSGFNANLCEVMADLTETLSGTKSEYSMLWSPEYEVPAELQNLDPVEIDPKVFRPFFEAAAKSLRQVKESQDTPIVGAIVQLRAEDADDEDQDEGRQITVRWDLGNGRSLKIRVTLDADAYKAACDAHRDHRRVTVMGRPEKQGKFWVLTSPRDFSVVA